MKKIYTLLSLAAIGFSSFAQQQTMPHVNPNSGLKLANVGHIPSSAQRKAAHANLAPLDTIAYETFAGGIPSGWTQSGTDQIWRRTSTFTSGTYSYGWDITSSSRSDGYMIYDADSAGKSIGADPTTTVYNGALISSSYDFSAYTGVNVSFQQYFILWGNSPSITFSVSIDGGTTWTDYDANHGLAQQSFPSNPDLMSFNISSIAAGQPNVMFKWNFDSNLYFWLMDDFVITEAANNDIAMGEVNVDQSYIGGGFYTQTPVQQLDTIAFRGIVQNTGNAAQTNVMMNVDVWSTTALAFSEMTGTTLAGATLSTLAPGTQDTLITQNAFVPPAVVDTFTVIITSSQTEIDEVPSNDSGTVMIFAVSDSVFARDNGVITGTSSSSYYSGGEAPGGSLGNIYETSADDSVTSVSTFIRSSSDTGIFVIGKLFIYDTSVSDFVQVAASEIYDITTSADKGKWVTLPFSNGTTKDTIPVVAGATYLAVIENGGTDATHSVNIAEDRETAQPDRTSWVFIPGSGWGWITSLPMIRLNTTSALVTGLNETVSNKPSVSQNQPNPFQGSTVINYNLPKASNVNVNVFDVTGKSLITLNEGMKSSGPHVLNLNASSLAAGVYYYTVKAGDASVTKKMVIIE